MLRDARGTANPGIAHNAQSPSKRCIIRSLQVDRDDLVGPRRRVRIEANDRAVFSRVQGISCDKVNAFARSTMRNGFGKMAMPSASASLRAASA